MGRLLGEGPPNLGRLSRDSKPWRIRYSPECAPNGVRPHFAPRMGSDPNRQIARDDWSHHVISRDELRSISFASSHVYDHCNCKTDKHLRHLCSCKTLGRPAIDSCPPILMPID